MKTLAILGAGGHGKVVAEMAEASGWESIDFYDDSWPTRKSCRHWPIKGNSLSLLEDAREYAGVVVAIGNNAVRRMKLLELERCGANIVTIQHPQAVISQYASIGPGTVIMAGAVVNVDTRIGTGCILNSRCSIDHDCNVGDFAHISPGSAIAGGVKVGTQSWVGIGATVKQSITLGQNVMVGAGAAVIHDVGDNLQVIGVPAIPKN